MLKWTLSFVLLLPLATQAQETLIYLSPSGNDANPGTKNQPKATFNAAREIWRKSPGQPTKVILRGGTYYLDVPWELTPADNPSGQPFTITAAPGEKPVLSGARKVTVDWREDANGTWKASLPAAPDSIDRLYIGGQLKIMARYPNYDVSARFYHGTSADALSPARIKSWKKPEGAIVHALHRAEWGGYHYIVTGVDDKGDPVLTGGWQNNRQMGLHPEHRFVENVREELDAPNEWHYDAGEKTIYFKPEDGRKPAADIAYAQLTELVILKGSMSQPIKNITIRGITFTGNTRTFMKTIEPLLRSDWTIYRGGAVLVEGAEHSAITNCHFDAVGGNAIFINNYNRHVRADSNLIYQAGASGIAFVGSPDAVRSPAFEYNKFVPYTQMDMTPGPKSEDYPKDCSAADNLIQFSGEIEKQSAGVQISIAAKIRVAHNTIHNVPRAGINVSDGTFGGHLIERNDVYNTVLETGDHGAFNSWGRDRFWHPNRRTMDSATINNLALTKLDISGTTIIRENRFRCDHGWDIDLDDGSSYYDIYDNVCLNGGLKLREGFFRRVHHNLLINNTFHPHVWFANSNDVFSNNVVTTDYKPIQVNTWGKKVDHNYFPDKASLAAAQKRGTDSNSIVLDLQFVDFKKGDYRLKPSSKPKYFTYRDFPVTGFGTRIAAYKKLAAPVPLPAILISSATGKGDIMEWKGAKVKNIEGLGERSATGLPDEKGAYFVEVPQSSDAYKAGLRSNDVVLQLDGQATTSAKAFFAVYQPIAWRTNLKVVVFRNQREQEIVLK
ncbi:PDZ domain-containing protein [Chitinophaga sp.]|mgnify:CR=1 FL=1|uniref:PDZ domain-containing protein n=1 Tax=Chitinophaga sp. TaxID=1869181 RepID=UPI0026097505|nr:PDZ domain-containing protein [uncultured Chitinophaga sp.]